MPTFKYLAQGPSGKPMNGSLEASNREAALKLLSQQNLKPLTIEESKAKKGTISLSIGGSKIKSKDLVIFTRQLSTMVSAGVPLLRALTTLTNQTDNEAFRKVLDAVTKDVQGGAALGDAFAKHPKAFNEVYINMVRAGESGGILDDILKRLATQQEKADSMRKKIKSAMTYPMILVIITIGAFFGLMLFVMPQIGQILHDLGGPDAELPALTQAMLGISEAFQSYWYLILLGGGGGLFLLRRYIKTPAGKSQFHHIIIKFPIIGTIVMKVAVARFARTFASLIGAGVSVLEALRVTGDALGNVVFQNELTKAAQEVENGKPLSIALEASPFFPAIISQMLSVGEETGQTDQVLVKVADFYEEEVDTLIDSLSSILEPLMIVMMGAMVGLIGASVMGPIAELSQNIQ
jgi:type IV pilus assembly protein PilC